MLLKPSIFWYSKRGSTTVVVLVRIWLLFLRNCLWDIKKEGIANK